MPKFCGNCGSMLDENTGLCSVCSAEEKTVAVESISQPINPVNYNQQVANENIQQPQQFYVPEQQDEAAPNNKKKNKKAKQKQSNKGSGLTVFVTILLAFCLFITSFLTVAIYDIRNSLTKDNAKKLLNNIDFIAVIKNSSDKGEKNLESFYDFLDNNFDIEMKDKNLRSFLEDSTFAKFVGNKISYFAKELFSDNKAKMQLRVSDIHDFLDDNADLIEDEFDVYLDYGDKEEIAEWVLPKDDLSVIETKSMPTLFTTLRFGLSYFTIILFALISALIIFFMFKNNLSQAALGVGINFIVIGALFGICYVVTLITPLWQSLCNTSVIFAVVGNVFAINAIVSAILFGIGVLTLVARKIVLIILKKKANA